MDRAHGEIGRWGTKLRRLRIDHIEIDNLDLDGLSDPSYMELKIIMLRPSRQRLDNLSFSSSTDLNQTSVRNLALSIAKHTLPALRVIVIGPCWFWVEKREGDSVPAPTLWDWGSARQDAAQSLEIFEHLSPLDWSFLTNTKILRHDERDHVEWNKGGFWPHLPIDPSWEMKRMWNFMTILPEV